MYIYINICTYIYTISVYACVFVVVRIRICVCKYIVTVACWFVYPCTRLPDLVHVHVNVNVYVHVRAYEYTICVSYILMKF